MSYDLAFWKYKDENYPENAAAIYDCVCCRGESREELDKLPIREILGKLGEAFGNWDKTGELNYESEDNGVFQISTTAQSMLFECYGLSLDDTKKIIDVMHSFGCYLFDPQCGDRDVKNQEENDCRELELFSAFHERFQDETDYAVPPKYGIPSDNDMADIEKMAGIPLPQMLVTILREGRLFHFKVKDTGYDLVIWYWKNILFDQNDFWFKKSVKEGFVFGMDLRGNLFFYGNGREGLGLYTVNGYADNYYEEAHKFADTFEEFFIDGKGCEVLDKIYQRKKIKRKK